MPGAQEEVSLGERYTQFGYDGELRLRFDAFRDEVRVVPRREGDERFQDGLKDGFVTDIPD